MPLRSAACGIGCTLADARDNQRGVLAAKADVVRQNVLAVVTPCCVRHVVQIASGVRVVQVDGRWNDFALKGQQARRQLDRAARGRGVTEHAFDTGNRN